MSRLLAGRFLLSLSAAVMAMTVAAHAEERNRLVGSWTLVYVNDERAEGPALPLFGPRPAGILMFDNAGNYSLQVCASGRPKFAAGNRLLGTTEEYRAAASACNTHWGRYAVKEREGVIVFNIEHALFPNWEGTTQSRPFRLMNGLLRYQVTRPSIEAENPIVVWRRMTGDN